MKTLDEVIDALERCSKPHYFDCKGCPYEDDDAEVGCRSDDRDADVLHYLREYRDKHDDMLKMEEALGYCLMADNRPLTWEQLKQMEGKPVWVEADYFEKGWFLVDASLVDIWVTGYDCAEHQLREEDIGASWQAYRKER